MCIPTESPRSQNYTLDDSPLLIKGKSTAVATFHGQK